MPEFTLILILAIVAAIVRNARRSVQTRTAGPPSSRAGLLLSVILIGGLFVSLLLGLLDGRGRLGGLSAFLVFGGVMALIVVGVLRAVIAAGRRATDDGVPTATSDRPPATRRRPQVPIESNRPPATRRSSAGPSPQPTIPTVTPPRQWPYLETDTDRESPSSDLAPPSVPMPENPPMRAPRPDERQRQQRRSPSSLSPGRSASDELVAKARESLERRRRS